MIKIKHLFTLLRVDHYVKNLVIFLPAFFGGEIFGILSDGRIYDLLMLFIAFSAASSFVYVMNDMVDLEADKLHPKKSMRPLASGVLSKKNAAVLSFVLLAVSVSLSLLLKTTAIFIFLYVILNVFYSLKLKHIAILDVSCIGLGFIVRILAGGFITSIFVSHWMIVIAFLLSVSIAFEKRRDDLVTGGLAKDYRQSLSDYNIAFVDVAKTISYSITLIAYILYTLSPEVTEKMGSDNIYITALFVFAGIMRYLQISIVKQKAGSPVKVMLQDRFMQINLLLWLLSFFVVIYV